MKPLVYSGVVFRDERGPCLRLEVFTDEETIKILKDASISIEPGNDDIVNFYAAFKPALELGVNGPANIFTSAASRYGYGRALARASFVKNQSVESIWGLEYWYPEKYPEDAQKSQWMIEYSALWGDGIMPFVIAHVPEFCAFLSMVKTFQTKLVVNHGGDVIESCGIGACVIDENNPGLDAITQVFSTDPVIHLEGKVKGTVPISIRIGDTIRNITNTVITPQKNVDIVQETQRALNAERSLAAQRMASATDMLKKQIGELQKKTYAEIFNFAARLHDMGWECRPDGYHYTKRIDVIYVMDRSGKSYEIPSGNYWIDEIHVPYGPNISAVHATGRHPHLMGGQSVCTGNLDRSRIQNILLLPELLKTAIFETRFSNDSEVGKLVKNAKVVKSSSRIANKSVVIHFGQEQEVEEKRKAGMFSGWGA